MNTEKTINQLIQEFITDLDVLERTRYSYKMKLNLWFRFLNIQKVNVRAPRKADVISYKSHLLSDGKTSTTIDGYLTVVRMFYKWLAEGRIYKEVAHGEFINIAEGVHSPKRYKGFQKSSLSADQVIQLLDSMPKDTVSEFRDFAIVNFLVRTGVRRCELHRANVGDLVCQNGHWNLKIQRKGHFYKDQVIGLSEAAAVPLHEYILMCGNEKKPDAPILLNHSRYNHNQRLNIDYISALVKKTLRSIGIDSKEFSSHSLRHTSAVMALRAGASIYEVQKMLGHSSTATTEIYLSSAESEMYLINPAISAIGNALKKQAETTPEQA